ncbi:hypothetical protein RJT34_07529 [Clitoria ternatea]|uniref:TF-B3 domain-containing protein n=1 Tax=Clitoria ternatea TaxID=43366 RepID=A0AAN9PS97_CLITE
MTFPCGRTNKHHFSTSVFFFKIILRTSLADTKLKLTKSFTRKYGGGISNPLFLKPPDGTEWEICWTKNDGEVWFQKGWEEFAKYYSLDHGHLLLFEYKGPSNFDVHIFDTSALEIDYPYRCTHDGKGYNSDDSVEILEQSPCQKNLVRSTVSSANPSLQNSLRFNFSEEGDEGICNTECPKVEQLGSTKISVALRKASTLKPKHPSFMLVMKPPFVNGEYLKVPQHFAEKYLKKRHAVVLLEVLDGRSWPVIYSDLRISMGWQKFASENNLNVGDVCVFELIHKIQGLCFKVSIFGNGEGSSCPISQAGNAVEDAKKFTSKNPTFMVRITHSSSMVRVPGFFVREYFADNKKNVKIRFKKKLWHVRFVLDVDRRGQGRLCGGWTSLARESELEAGDVCIFELINREDAVFDVHIFRGHT